MTNTRTVRKQPETPDRSTEEKIKEAARTVFTRKGFAATRTRDIAEEAGLNLALLNYYFRSKEKLFEIVMLEKMQVFFGFIGPIIYDESTTLEMKVEGIVSRYIDMLQENPDIPFFIMGEARNNPAIVANSMPRKDFLRNSFFIKQLKEKKPDQDPYQFLLSMLGMIIFPFLMKPVFQKITDTDDPKFRQMMKARRELIPVWCRAILKAK
jgi:AcrR family transcriptional regulator